MEPAMDKAAVIREIGERLERIGRLAAAVPQPPNPRPQESDASLKRKIARLRSGVIRPADRDIDAATLAGAMERELEYRERASSSARFTTSARCSAPISMPRPPACWSRS